MFWAFEDYFAYCMGRVGLGWLPDGGSSEKGGSSGFLVGSNGDGRNIRGDRCERTRPALRRMP